MCTLTRDYSSGNNLYYNACVFLYDTMKYIEAQNVQTYYPALYQCFKPSYLKCE